MCGICGCSEEDITTISDPIHSHSHTHSIHSQNHLMTIEKSILDKNNEFAQLNQQMFQKSQITAMNLMSSPGSGKTTLLAKTVSDLKALDITIIVGDQETDYDAEKLKSSGAQAIQVNTGKVCHLDAHRINHVLEEITLKKNSLLFIENVGNLVCPALFELGESFKIVILSVTEGDNKPLKYPEMFRKADLLLITKMDLLPYVEFDVDTCIDYAKRINPAIQSLTLSATQGVGLEAWYEWLSKLTHR